MAACIKPFFGLEQCRIPETIFGILATPQRFGGHRPDNLQRVVFRCNQV
jgi:hypothetical protein